MQFIFSKKDKLNDIYCLLKECDRDLSVIDGIGTIKTKDDCDTMIYHIDKMISALKRILGDRLYGNADTMLVMQRQKWQYANRNQTQADHKWGKHLLTIFQRYSLKYGYQLDLLLTMLQRKNCKATNSDLLNQIIILMGLVKKNIEASGNFIVGQQQIKQTKSKIKTKEV